jgi:signal transduction histidine kinase/ActR/RegA family two-component response regulator
VRYAYRLEGVDRTWVQAGTRREASYGGVRPGRYVFHVIADDGAGLWSREGATVTVVVAAPWWATWWARLAALLGLGGAIAGVVHLRLLATNRRAAWLAERVDAQTRELTDAQARLSAALERERETARELAAITAAVPGAVFQLREAADGGRTFSFVSEGVAPLLGAAADAEDPRRIAERLLAQIHPADVGGLAATLAASRDALAPLHAEFRVVDGDGDGGTDAAERWVEAHARPAREADGGTVWTGVATDATAARRAEAARAALEARVLHAQKAESLAVLAGGIAHDFNNLLVGVLANADLLEEDLPPGGDAAETAGLIRSSALRAAELTQQMLAYAGRGRLVVERVDLARLVPDMLALVRSAVPRTVAFDVRRDAASVPVEADATQLRQVVMNLATNAAEAIGDRAGRVTVRVGVETASAAELALLHAAPDMPARGPYARVEVEDDGCGMEASLLARIFDPFYSTKFTGRGLGLAALLGVVRAHRGGLRVDTAPGRGSRFALYLPLAPQGAGEPAGPPPAAAPAETAETPAAGRGARVLIVDDEPAVLRTAARVVGAAGHEVDTAGDGEAALERLAAGPPVDLVLIDMTMPRLDGLRTVAAARARGIDVPVILMSGYSEEEILGAGSAAATVPIDGFLKKPFTPTQLRQALEALLAPAAG